jgi:hypothetical protein
LIDERHRIDAQIEQPRVNTGAFLRALKNLARRLFRNAALASAADNDGDDRLVAVRKRDQIM